MQTAPHNSRKMVAQIKLCKRSFKITCSSFSALKVDLQSIGRVTPGSSGISVGTEGSANPKSSLYRKTLKVDAHKHQIPGAPGLAWTCSVRCFLRPPSSTPGRRGHLWKSSRSSLRREISQTWSLQNGDALYRVNYFAWEATEIHVKWCTFYKTAFIFHGATFHNQTPILQDVSVSIKLQVCGMFFFFP